MSSPSDARVPIVDLRVQQYLRDLRPSDDDLIDRLEAHATEHGFPLIGRNSGYWLELLTQMVSGHRVFEFGSGFGFSAFFFARGVGPGGEVIGCDKDQHELDAHAALFAGHPLADRIDIRLGDAFDVFENTQGVFDVVLLDLDKVNYRRAFDVALPRLRKGGLILADNTLWGAKVTYDTTDESTAALKAFNAYVHSHPGVTTAILPIGDGLGTALKL
jgi:caffeoyl-CoA O-methyltransferase